MSVKHIVTLENYQALQNFTVQTDYCNFILIEDAVADPVSFLNSPLHVGQSVSEGKCCVTIMDWVKPEGMYFKEILREAHQKLNQAFVTAYPEHIEQMFISITDFQGKNNRFYKETLYKNLPAIFTLAQQLYRKVFIVVDADYPNIEIGDFKAAITSNRTLVLNVGTEGIGWMSVNTDEEVIRFACRFHGKEQIVSVPFDALLAVYDPVDSIEIFSKGQIFDNSQAEVDVSVVEKTQPPKRPTFQVIDGGKS